MRSQSGWHFQVVHSVLPQDGEDVYEIHEAYPGAMDEVGGLVPITTNAVSPYGETIESLKWMLNQMLVDIDRYGIVEAADYEEKKDDDQG
jgi:hypothetical protein